MQPGMVIVEVPFSRMVRLVGEIVQLEEEGQICQSTHLELRGVFGIAKIIICVNFWIFNSFRPGVSFMGHRQTE